MSQVKKIAMAAGTFSVALGIGFVMQNGDALASRFSAGDVAAAPPRPAVVPAEEQVADAQVVIPEQAPVPAMSPLTQVVPSDPVDEAAESEPVLSETDATPTEDLALADAESPSIQVPDVAPIVAAVLLPGPIDTIQRGIQPTQPVQLAALGDEFDTMDSVTEGTDAQSLAESGCDAELTAKAAEASFVTLSLTAPCHGNSPAVIHHQGVMFTVLTDADGHAEFIAPALAEVAVFIAAFDDDEGAVATIAVPDFADYDRAVLQWQGDLAVNLSAYEFGAGFGEEGHIWTEATQSADRALTGKGGFMVPLGDPSLDNSYRAEVYVFPTGMAGRDGDVTLVTEVEITADNCGQQIAAQSIQVGPGGESSALDLTLVVPACDAVGDYLVLQNMFQDLTVAAASF